MNCRHTDFQSVALPTELPRHRKSQFTKIDSKGQALLGPGLFDPAPSAMLLYKMQPIAKQILYSANQQADSAHNGKTESGTETEHDYPDTDLRTGTEEQPFVRL